MNTTKNARVCDDVAVDISPFVRKYNDGRVERILHSPFVAASEDPGATRGVATRDVVIDHINGVSARLFLPSGGGAVDDGRLPVVLYIHGGSFCTESAFGRTYHRYASSLASRAGALLVSVEYRLAPEHPLPVAYDDAWAVLRWVSTLSDPWLANYADPTRTFIAGDSAGGNIAYHTALRASRDGDDDMDIEGLIVVHPYFWGTDKLPSETAWDVESSAIKPDAVERLWPFVTAGKAGNDDPRINPSVEEIASLTCRRALVAVAEKDFLCGRGRQLAARMRAGRGWAGDDVTLVESEGEDHGFHLYAPLRATSRKLMESMVQFINQSTTDASRWPASVLPDMHECTPLCMRAHSKASRGAIESAQLLLGVPCRPYQAVFLDGPDLKPGRGPSCSMQLNNATTVVDGIKASKRNYLGFFGHGGPNNWWARKDPMPGAAPWLNSGVKSFF